MIVIVNILLFILVKWVFFNIVNVVKKLFCYIVMSWIEIKMYGVNYYLMVINDCVMDRYYDFWFVCNIDF